MPFVQRVVTPTYLARSRSRPCTTNAARSGTVTGCQRKGVLIAGNSVTAAATSTTAVDTSATVTATSGITTTIQTTTTIITIKETSAGNCGGGGGIEQGISNVNQPQKQGPIQEGSTIGNVAAADTVLSNGLGCKQYGQRQTQHTNGSCGHTGYLLGSPTITGDGYKVIPNGGVNSNSISAGGVSGVNSVEINSNGITSACTDNDRCIAANSVSTCVGGTVSRSVPSLTTTVATSSQPASGIVNDFEFESVTNITLSNALRQLASLVLIANDIFMELNKELHCIGDRSKGIKMRIDGLEKRVEKFDPKMVTVPESDLETFVQIKKHFESKLNIDKELFTAKSRSVNLQELYEAAGKTPITAIRELANGLNGAGDHQSRRDSDLLCTPVLGQTHRKMRTRVDVEIETRLPAAVEELRKWTSTEALGDITVTPDCISRVGFNSSIMNNSTFCSSNNASEYGPTSLRIAGVSTDVTDDNSTVIGHRGNRTANEDSDQPLDHRLPSPEEQCQIIALKFPAEVVTVDTSGKRFERMCLARKSMMHYTLIGDHNNLNDDVQTIKRRSRSRKPRGKRRNTIAGTDQKEIEEAANGDLASGTSPNKTLNEDKPKIVPRSKSSDLLKKDSPLSTILTESSKTTLTRFNSLKQWGRNRLRLMNRSDEKKDKEKDKDKDKVLDIDNDSNVYEAVVSKNKKKFAEKERKLSHERKPSYSSSEKSLTITSNSSKAPSTTTSTATAPTTPVASASINPVKLRESSSIRRQRRNGLGQKDEPHSSSGNWSASSESGRTSIGSEITVQPKSSASSTSLNHSHHHPGSGPPSSVISRRRFLNTSASSSVTSEGTATPDLQVHDLCYDDETSSAYSCDTEGYYTSFHVDSGLKPLKEEEPMTPMHSTSALSSNNSFGSSTNQTILSAENEYELFGRGSTSTTTSSAGTVCTTLMAADHDKSSVHGPAVPERKSSLTKLHRSNSNASNSTLERSYSSSTVGSTLERTGTIKRNGVLQQKEVSVIVHQERPERSERHDPRLIDPKLVRIESPDSGNNTSSSPIETNSNESPTQGLRSNSEFEYSECSDLEGVDRIERIRIKTTINSSRIPSMCIITPTTSDDETVKDSAGKERQKLELPPTLELGAKGSLSRTNSTSVPVQGGILPPQETDLDTLEFTKEAIRKDDNKVQIISVNKSTGYATVHVVEPQTSKPNLEVRKDANFNNFKRSTLQPFNNMLGRLKGVLPTLKKSPNKEAIPDIDNESIYDTAGEYVTIADVRNNNNNTKRPGNGIYYSNDVIKRNLATVLSGNLNQETEYVSLNELPSSIRCEESSTSNSIGTNLLPLLKIVDASSLTAATKTFATTATTPTTTTVQNKGKDSVDMAALKEKSFLASGQSQLGEGGIGRSDDAECESGGTNTMKGRQEQPDGGYADTLQEEQGRIQKQEQELRRGARVTFDAQGKIIYNSDSLKRRKGAHTTFVPGPCVKDPESASPSPVEIVIPLESSQPLPSSSSPSSPSSTLPRTGILAGEITPKSPLLTGGCLYRKQGIVRPVISQSQYNNRNQPNMAAGILTNNPFLTEPDHISSLDSGNIIEPPTDGHLLPFQQNNQDKQLDDKEYQHLSHNEKEPFLRQVHLSGPSQSLPYEYEYSQVQTQPPTGQEALPFQRNNQVYWTLQHRRQPQTHTATGIARDDINVAKDAKNLDDLYATPNKVRNRNVLKTTPMGFSTFFSPIGKGSVDGITEQESVGVSPIDPRNTGGFKTSTPTKSGPTYERVNSPSRLPEEIRQRLLIKENSRSNNVSPSSSGRSTPLRGIMEPQGPRTRNSWAFDNGELPGICSDRLGTQKTSLMDFKKLLLATSTKNTTKMSAVQMLKVNKKNPASPPATPPPTSAQPSTAINTSMNILELSGSPKTFANRRVLRQGNFGSPSKSLGGKQRANWRMNATRTDVMSTAIPEANSEEDNSSSNGSIGSQSPNPPIRSEMIPEEPEPEKSVIEEKMNLKTNIFLQAEENNFMKGEVQLKTPIATGFTRLQLVQARAQFLMGGAPPSPQATQPSKLITQFNKKSTVERFTDRDTVKRGDGTHANVATDTVAQENNKNAAIQSGGMPSLETAL